MKRIRLVGGGPAHNRMVTIHKGIREFLTFTPGGAIAVYMVRGDIAIFSHVR